MCVGLSVCSCCCVSVGGVIIVYQVSTRGMQMPANGLGRRGRRDKPTSDWLTNIRPKHPLGTEDVEDVTDRSLIG